MERFPERIIIIDAGTAKLVVCKLSYAVQGVPVYAMTSLNYEHIDDAVRGAITPPMERPKIV